MSRYACVTALALVASGCLGDVARIPCHNDDQCPTGYFCGSVGECQSLAASSPPLLVFDGVESPSAPLGSAITLPKSGLNLFSCRVSNQGESSANNPEMAFEAVACLHLGIAENQVGMIDAGQTRELRARVDPDPACPTTSLVTVHLSERYSSALDFLVRPFPDGKFQIVLGP